MFDEKSGRGYGYGIVTTSQILTNELIGVTSSLVVGNKSADPRG